MSRDVDVLFTAPGSLFYHAETTLSPEQRYRLIDAPLPRTIIGISTGNFPFATPEIRLELVSFLGRK